MHISQIKSPRELPILVLAVHAFTRLNGAQPERVARFYANLFYYLHSQSDDINVILINSLTHPAMLSKELAHKPDETFISKRHAAFRSLTPREMEIIPCHLTSTTAEFGIDILSDIFIRSQSKQNKAFLYFNWNQI